MILRGVTIIGDATGATSVRLSGRMIAELAAGDDVGSPAPETIDFTDAIAFPGLINSHDHLEMNLYPQLGHGHYPDYLEWSHDIHRRDKSIISAIQGVPRWARARWGALKNLLCGVTSVAHHDEPVSSSDVGGLKILPGRSIHSVRLGGHWRWHLNSPFSQAPYVVHVGEGISPEMGREIDELTRWNLLRRDLIAVHGIAMTSVQAARFRAVVWCPLSNEFLFGVTADIRRIKNACAVVLGTDSTLTADWNIWNHLRRARRIGALTDDELFAAVTCGAAGVWGRSQTGCILPGYLADLVVARKKQPDPWTAFFDVDPEDILLVLRDGAAVVADTSLTGVTIAGPSSLIRIGGREKRVALDVARVPAALRSRSVGPNIDLTIVES